MRSSLEGVMGLTQGCYKTAHDEIHVPNITPNDLEQKRQEEIEDPEEPTEQTPQADPKVEPKPEKNTNDGGSESTANAGYKTTTQSFSKLSGTWEKHNASQNELHFLSTRLHRTFHHVVLEYMRS